MRLVERAGSPGLAVQGSAVQRRPLPVLPLRAVGDDDVRVQIRITRTTGAMPEGSGDEAVRLDLLAAPVPAASVACCPFEIAKRRLDSPVVGSAHPLLDLFVPQGPQHADALRSREG